MQVYVLCKSYVSVSGLCRWVLLFHTEFIIEVMVLDLQWHFLWGMLYMINVRSYYIVHSILHFHPFHTTFFSENMKIFLPFCHFLTLGRCMSLDYFPVKDNDLIILHSQNLKKFASWSHINEVPTILKNNDKHPSLLLTNNWDVWLSTWNR